LIEGLQKNQIQKNKDGQLLISIVVPAYDEERSIEETLNQTYRVLADFDRRYEVIVVDDGSMDGTFGCIQNLRIKFAGLKGIRFSRNFGKEAALLAGLQAAQGDAVITMDADLQHPPDLIPQMIAKWEEGAMVVHGIKKNAHQYSWLTRLNADIFSRLLTRYARMDVRNSTDFKLMDRIVVDIIVKQLGERLRFFRGLANWVGFYQENVYFDVTTRKAGESKWSIKSLLELFITGVVSFTSAPLRIVTILGLISLIFTLVVTLGTLWLKFHGYESLSISTIEITLMLIGSFILIGLGILGEYVARIYDEVRRRPGYLIDLTVGFDDNKKR